MSNTMAAHEPINYLDSILHEEEKRCEYGHQWRQFTISRSGRFKSKNKKRELIDGKIFDAANNGIQQNSSTTTATTMKPVMKLNNIGSDDSNKKNWNSVGHGLFKDEKISSRSMAAANKSFASPHSTANKNYNKPETYKSFYETNF